MNEVSRDAATLKDCGAVPQLTSRGLIKMLLFRRFGSLKVSFVSLFRSEKKKSPEESIVSVNPTHIANDKP